MHICISIPSLGTPHTIALDTVGRVTTAAQRAGHTVTLAHDWSGATIAYKRNRLAAAYLGTGADVWLTLDRDAGIAAEDVMRWIAAEDLDIIAAPRAEKTIDWAAVHAAVRRGATAEELPLFGARVSAHPMVTTESGAILAQQVHGARYFETYGAATHTMLVRRRVFDRIDAFDVHGDLLTSAAPHEPEWRAYYAETTLPGAMVGRPDAPSVYVGEDVYFCAQARAAGSRVWVAVDALSHHVGDFVYTALLGVRATPTARGP